MSPLQGSSLLEARILQADIPRAVARKTLLVATWNVRELGRSPRSRAALAMIARILSSFSLVSLVELRRDTRELEHVLRLLGPSWRTLYSEPLDDPGANEERACFLWDTRFVSHSGLVSVVHQKRRRVGEEYMTPHWWRAPYVASFRAGKRDIVFATAHVRWGNAGEQGRLGEIVALAAWAKSRAARLANGSALVLAGDLNVPSAQSPLFRALRRHGLEVPPALLGAHGTTLEANKRYDQILQVAREEETTSATPRFTARAGVLDFYRGDHEALFPRSRMGKPRFTREISDHLPLWAELMVG